ncbi:MAG: peptidoglycan DD-metalloendopeptidase family protein [Candidatus Rariloculaceae bacterium]
MKSYSGGVRHDYKDPSVDSESIQRRHWPWFLIGLLLPVITVSFLLVGGNNEPPTPAPVMATVQGPYVNQRLALPQPAGTPSSLEVAPEPEPGTKLSISVRSGDSMELIFRRNDLSLGDLAAMTGLSDAREHLRLLRPGDKIEISHRDGQVLSLEKELDEISLLQVTRGETGYLAGIQERAVDYRTVGGHGSIQNSLFEAGMAADISDAVIMNMAGILQWDIDFIQDVRVGDEFTVIYEELWRDGVKLRDGEIVAAEFINQGTPYRAARYIDSGGNSDYFTPEGRSVRKAFIRAPVNFTRVSSSFNLNRRHPVLNTIRAHRGVDYAAPSGTPVIAAGDGRVTFRGVQNGYGNTVIVQHGGNITTLYAHLSRFASPRVGSRVRQGETIAYVGQSGLATGPHLHYEYRLNGVHRNPRTVTLPPADPVPAEQWEDFSAAATPLWRQLDLYRGTRVSTAAAAN